MKESTRNQRDIIVRYPALLTYLTTLLIVSGGLFYMMLPAALEMARHLYISHTLHVIALAFGTAILAGMRAHFPVHLPGTGGLMAPDFFARHMRGWVLIAISAILLISAAWLMYRMGWVTSRFAIGILLTASACNLSHLVKSARIMMSAISKYCNHNRWERAVHPQ